MKLGISGALTRATISSPLTPMFLVAAILVGILALVALPREEEPQISVPMVDIAVTANGYKADDAIELITKPLETIAKGINGVEHVYSFTQDDAVLVTVRFKVGTDEDTALLRVHEKIRANIPDLPKGIPEPLIVGRGINDVAIVTLTLSPRPAAAERWTDNGLHRIADELRHELMKVEDVGTSYIVGGSPNQVRVEPDPERLALYGVTLNQLVDKLANANRSFLVGAFRQVDRNVPVVAGQTLQGVPDIGLLLLTTRDGRPVYVKDVATVIVGAAEPGHRSWMFTRGDGNELQKSPMVTVAFAKRRGANAVVVADELLHRLEAVRGRLVPEDITVTVSRNYGETATEKADELLFHLALATVSIVLLITVAVGWREGLVVLVVIPTTILLTLFAAWLMGYTINRVSLFALIFSIGILVDDAIVVVENIVRHWQMRRGGDLQATAVEAVAEVGNPTIVATLTIVVALLPMMFVSGLMGPYMSPIPANASMAMIFSFFVAVTITPWLLYRFAGRHFGSAGAGTGHGHDDIGRLGRGYLALARPLLTGRRRSGIFLATVGVATAAVCVLFATRDVTVKLLPFDNKSELQVVVDMPQSTTMEGTERFLAAAAEKLRDLPEMTSLQLYAGTAAPFNFNGLVRHYYFRTNPEQGDLQVNLVDKHHRSDKSHVIAQRHRPALEKIAAAHGARIQVVEVPPGPPVMSPLVAEVYGPDEAGRQRLAARVAAAFRATPDIVGIETTLEEDAPRAFLRVQRQRAESLGIPVAAVAQTVYGALSGLDAAYLHDGQSKYPVPVRLQLPREAQVGLDALLALPLRAANGQLVPLSELVRVEKGVIDKPLFTKDLHGVSYVFGDMAGRLDSPLYGLFAIRPKLKDAALPGTGEIAEFWIHQPGDPYRQYAIKWDGEWQITYETFRDMGAAYGVGLILIYLLVVAQFRNYLTPLIIMAPIPLTMIGVMPGHALLGSQFTATSMIGMIALAGIIVRNSILLVDFIELQVAQGMAFKQAVMNSAAVRAQPIALTGLAAMIGAFFILDDPIFNGLAIALIFGILVSTLLTLVVIPVLYFAVYRRRHPQGA